MFSSLVQRRSSLLHSLRRSWIKSSSTSSSYHSWTYEKNPTEETSQFIVSPANGFLPRADPLDKLPQRFEKLESLLQRMPIALPNGKPGLLGLGTFGEAVDKELPVYNVDDINDSALLMALFRDLTFAASSYLLEPCDLSRRKCGDFGLGRDRLPASIAVPLLKIADKIGSKPFMEYAQSYALYNYRLKDKSAGVTYDNLELIRQFSGLPSESGFVLVHVDMVAHSGDLVKYISSALNAVNRKDRYEFDESLIRLVTVMQKINENMEKMWKRSSPADYMKFRTFILGTKNQESIFPNGVIYEGTDDTKPRFYRGESGANDSIVPTVDNFLQLTQKMPDNDMTEILKDFRSYRPEDHARWLTWVENSAKELNVEKYAEESGRSLVFYMLLLNEIRDFRTRHWSFAREYIIKRTAYPKATGGSPMATWLPNQLSVVLQTLQNKYRIYEARNDRMDDMLPRNFSKDINAQYDGLVTDVNKISEMYGRYGDKKS